MSSEAYAGRVNRVMEYVRDHPGEDLDLQTLAGIANFSPFHFHRVFKAVAGETVAAFVRRARLERAAYLMKASPERPLTSIALDLGYPSLSEFSRVFRREYGTAPTAWDRRSRLDGVTTCDPKTVQRTSSIEARVVEHSACRLAYVRTRCYFVGDELSKGFVRLTSWLEQRGLDWRREKMMGMSWDHYEVTPLDQVRFDLGFTVPPRIAAEGEVGIHEFPALQSVEVHCQAGLESIARAWDYLYDEWLPNSPYEPDDLPPMKRFRRRPDEIGWDTWDVDCCIPIRPARP